MNKKLVATFTLIGIMMSALFVSADVGIQPDWFYRQISYVVAIAAGAMAAFAVAQKQTVKAIITLVIGAIVFFVVRSPEGIFAKLGEALTKVFGL